MANFLVPVPHFQPLKKQRLTRTRGKGWKFKPSVHVSASGVLSAFGRRIEGLQGVQAERRKGAEE
jgi:hypothetical protein